MSRGLGALLNRLLLNGKLSSLLLARSRGGLLGLGNLFLLSLGSLLILASVLKETLNGCLANHLDTCNLLALKLLKQSALVLPIIELELHLPKSLKCLFLKTSSALATIKAIHGFVAPPNKRVFNRAHGW